MKFTRVSSLLIFSASFLVVGLGHAAENLAVKPAAASAVVAVQASAVSKAVVGKVPTKPVATNGTAITGKAGDSSIPSGSIPIPPKPKKEGLEAAGAIKAKAAQP